MDNDPSAFALVGTKWRLLSLDGQPPLPGTRLTIEFDAQGAGGNAGCNSYGLRATITGDTLSVSGVGHDLLYCAAPAGIMAQEKRFLRSLHGTHTCSIEGDRLSIRNDQGGHTLIFGRMGLSGMKSDLLLNTHWRLLSIDGQRAGARPPITLGFHDEMNASGSVGHDRYMAYCTLDDEIVVFPVVGCVAPGCVQADVPDLESRYIDALRTTTHYLRTEDRLELYTTGQGLLVFEADGRCESRISNEGALESRMWKDARRLGLA